MSQNRVRLVVRYGTSLKASYLISHETTNLGREPFNDIVLNFTELSRRHARIVRDGDVYVLEDLNSTNGTYVNGKLIKKHALGHDDVITVGHHQLRYIDDQADEAPEDEFEKTMVIEPSAQMEKQVAKAAAAAAAAAKNDAPPPQPVRMAAASGGSYSPTSTQDIAPEDAPASLPTAKLQVLSGTFAGRELELTKALTTLGRPGVQVAAITRRAEGYYIVHVESGEQDNYPLVNGMKIGAQARRLQDNDVIQLAGVKMGFFMN